MLRDWLGACLAEKLGAAIEWKRHQPKGAKTSDEIKEEPLDDGHRDMIDAADNPETTFSYDHSNIYVNVESSFEVGENTFLQIKDLDDPEERFPVVLSDGRTMIRAEFDEDVVRLFEKRHQRRLTQIVGGMINPSEFTIRATPLGDKQLRIVLVIRNFTYRKGSAGTGSAGHPKFAHNLPSVLELLDSLRELMLEDMRRDPNSGLKDAAVIIHDDTTDVLVEHESISDPLSQTEPASQEFATQAPIRDRPRKQIPDLSIAPGTNLARPVRLSASVQNKGASTIARNLLTLMGLPQSQSQVCEQPDPEPPVQPIRSEMSVRRVGSPSHVSGYGSEGSPDANVVAASRSVNTSNVISTETHAPPGAAEPVRAAPLEHIEEKEQIVSTPHLVHNTNPEQEQEQASAGAPPEPRSPLVGSVVAPNNVPQQETKAVEVAEESSTLTDLRRPHPKYVKYARRRIDRSQRELIEKPVSWCPSETRIPFQSYNIPSDLLKELADAHKMIHVRNEESVGTQRSKLGVASIEDQSQDGDGQDLDKDEPADWTMKSSQPFSSWCSSPEAHLQPRLSLGRDELPLDSSAQSPPPSSPPTRSSDAMDLDGDSDGSDDSELAEAVPRPLRTEHSLHHQVIKATPVELTANVKAGLKTPTQHSSSIVVDSTARLSGQVQAHEQRDGHPSQTISSSAKRPLEDPEKTAPKPKMLHRRPIGWGTDEESKEDPAKTLQRERSERLRRESEQAPFKTNDSRSPFSFPLTGPPQDDRHQIPSERRHTNRAPLDYRSKTQSQTSPTNGEKDNARNKIPRASANPKYKTNPKLQTGHGKLALEEIDMKLGPGWFSGIPHHMRNGAIDATQLSTNVVLRLNGSVQYGDNIQDHASAWQGAIDRRRVKETRPADVSESTWAGLLPQDILAVTNSPINRPRDKQGQRYKFRSLPREPPHGQRSRSRSPPRSYEDESGLAFHPSVGIYRKTQPPLGVQRQGHEPASTGPTLDTLPPRSSSQGGNQSITTPAVASPSTDSASSKRKRNAFAQQRELDSLPRRSIDPQYLQSPNGESSSPRNFTAPREPQSERRLRAHSPSSRSGEEQRYIPHSPPRGPAREQRFHSRSPSRRVESDRQYRPRSPPGRPENEQRFRPRSPPRAPSDQQYSQPGSPPRRWPGETTYPVRSYRRD